MLKFLRNSSRKAQNISPKLHKEFKSPQGRLTLWIAYTLLTYPFRYQITKSPRKARYDFQALEESVLEDGEEIPAGDHLL